MLSGTKIPIMSGALIALVGNAGCGKSHNMLRICKEYQDQSAKTFYDLDTEEPLLNGPVTASIYCSPTVNSDMTLKKEASKLHLTLVEGTESNILQLDKIIRLQDNTVRLAIESYQNIRAFMRHANMQRLMHQVVLEHAELDPNDQIITLLRKQITFVESTKKQYPELKIKEPDAAVLKYTKMLYEALNIDAFDGCWLRRPKYILMFDDISGTTLLQHTTNDFYRMMTQRRHINIFCFMVAVHGSTVMYSCFRQALTGILLFAGMKEQQVRSCFDEIG